FVAPLRWLLRGGPHPHGGQSMPRASQGDALRTVGKACRERSRRDACLTYVREHLAKKKSNFYPVILAGGRGTRFWPLSRKHRAKQMLALDGKQTMIQQTVARLLPLAPPKSFWVITNEDLRTAIARQLPRLEKRQIIAEPVGRNTAPAIGLAAFLLLR